MKKRSRRGKRFLRSVLESQGLRSYQIDCILWVGYGPAYRRCVILNLNKNSE